MVSAATPQIGRDPSSIAGKFARPEQQFDVVVIGAGPSGAKAAIQAARAGRKVLLVDENPVDPGLIGLDVPLYYGGRASVSVQDSGRTLEQVFNARPLLAEAFSAGVDVALGTSAWGAFVNGPALNALPQSVVGLADQERSWLCGFQELVVAAGARDLSLAFKGWDQPGVMGARALRSLLTDYNAFAGRRLIVLGSGDLGLQTVLTALERGLQVAAVVEVRDRVQGSSTLADRVMAAGVRILTSYAPIEAVGGVAGVTHLIVGSARGGGGDAEEIACDTICQAVGLVPVVELLSVLGAELTFNSALGGHVPLLHDGADTSLPNIRAIGACTGSAVGPEGPDYALDWTRALMTVGDQDVLVCQCESVTRAALIGVQHPGYLGPPPLGMNSRSLTTLAKDGPVSQDQIKRLTRACMGPCQARRCREGVALTLAIAANIPLSDIPLASYRAPVRPLPLNVLADWEELAPMTGGWDVWFGIPSQWVPYQDIDTDREARHQAALGRNAHL